MDAAATAAGVDPPPSASRWAALACFAYLNVCQGWWWSLYGPISGPVGDVLGIDSNGVETLTNLGNILFLVASVPCALWLDRGHYRAATVGTAALMGAGAVLRALGNSASTASTAMVYAAACANALAGTVAMGGVSAVASTYFPLRERALATAVIAEANSVGLNIAVLLGPAMVPDSDAGQMARYNAVGLAAAAVLVGGTVLAFPRAPARAPSASADAARAAHAGFTLAGFAAAVRALGRSRDFWLLALSYGAVSGIYGCWESVLDLVLGPLGYDEATVGWLSCASSLAGSLLGMGVGALLDRRRVHKALAVALFVVAAVSGAAFWALTTPSVVGAWGQGTGGLVCLFGVTLLSGVAVNASLPVFYEMLMEAAFGLAPENTVLLMALNLQNLLAVPFLAVPAGPWMTPVMAGAIAVAAVVVGLGVTAQSKRFAYDTGSGGGEGYGAELALPARKAAGDGAGAGDAELDAPLLEVAE